MSRAGLRELAVVLILTATSSACGAGTPVARPAPLAQAPGFSLPSSVNTSGSSTSPVPPRAAHGLVPAESQYPAAGVCGPSPGLVVVIETNPDTPAPRCTSVTASQHLEVVNTSDRFGQPGHAITVRLAPFPPRAVAVGAKTDFQEAFGRFLAPGVHTVLISLYGDSGPELWLKSP